MLLLITATIKIPANVGPILPWQNCIYLTLTLTLTLTLIPHLTLIPALILTPTLILTLTLSLTVKWSQAQTPPEAYPSSAALSTDVLLLVYLLFCYHKIADRVKGPHGNLPRLKGPSRL